MSPKRKDSGYGGTDSAALDGGSELKVRDFALGDRDANHSIKCMRGPRKTASTTKATAKADKSHSGSVWKRMGVTAFTKLSGKA